MPLAQVNGISLYYEEYGRGRPLVWSHGFALGARMWDPQVARFGSDYRVIVYDVRGHGASGAPTEAAEYSQPHSVEDLRGLLDHLGVEQACVGGLSMGGNIALNLALAHPERVAGLIIADTGAGSDPETNWRSSSGEWAATLERGIEAFADAALANPLFARYASQGPAAARLVRSLITTHRAHGLAHTAREVMGKRPTIYSLEPKLKALNAPALVIVGEYDEPCLKVSRYMAETLPRAELATMRGVGHLTNLEDPATFNALVARFLERLWLA